MREQRPLLDLQAPSLIVAQMQVELIEPVAGGDVDDALNVGDAVEVTSDVEHHTTHCMDGGVRTFEMRHPVTGTGLKEDLNCPVGARFVGCRQPPPVRLRSECVSL